MDQELMATARKITAMLERLSADSLWAHRASGLRGSLYKAIDRVEASSASADDDSELERLIQKGFFILEEAAKEICVKE
jgi:hypothetical protein